LGRSTTEKKSEIVKALDGLLAAHHSSFPESYFTTFTALFVSALQIVPK